MNLQQTRLGLVLGEAGVELAVDSFDQRLVLQKSIHLLQESGVHLGYHFRWYLRGPYSPSLTEDVFALVNLPDKGAKELGQWKLDEPSRGRLEKFVALVKARPTKEKLAKWLELLSSALFLVRTGQAQAMDYAGITSILHKNKKPFTEAEVRHGLELLKAHGFPV